MQWFTGLILLAGMAAHLVMPLSSQAQKTAFAQWLDHKVEDTNKESESTIRYHIRQLPSQSESFDLLLREASLLITAYQSDFKLPVKENEGNPGDLGQWLIKQWSNHQDHSSQDTVLPESIQPLQKWLLHQHNPLKGSAVLSNFARPLQKYITETPVFVLKLLPIPFLSGTSINAP